MKRLAHGLLVIALLPWCAALSQRPDDKQSQAPTPAQTATPQPTPTATIAPVPKETPRETGGGNGPNQEAGLDWGSVADWAMVVVTGFAVIYAGLTLGVIRRQTKIALQQATAAVLAERAYLSIDYPDGGLWIATAMVTSSNGPRAGVPVQDCRLTMLLHNKGNTPARVTYSFFDCYGDETPIPTGPSYPPQTAGQSLASGLLVRGENMRLNIEFDLTGDGVDKLKSNKIGVWIYGYVDYIDEFKVRRRFGHARRVKPAGSRGNDKEWPTHIVHGLVYDVVVNSYNYDRERLRGEGNDWDQ